VEEVALGRLDEQQIGHGEPDHDGEEGHRQWLEPEQARQRGERQHDDGQRGDGQRHTRPAAQEGHPPRADREDHQRLGGQ
jgi:hypothetical protein